MSILNGQFIERVGTKVDYEITLHPVCFSGVKKYLLSKKTEKFPKERVRKLV